MRSSGIRLVATWTVLGLAAAVAPVARSAPACAGDACDSIVLSDDGCVWKNASDKPVKFSLFNATETLLATVLPPGETFRQVNKAACVSSSPGSPQYQAVFTSVRKMPDAPDFTLKTTSATTAPVPAVPKVATPRAKPDASVATVEVPAAPASTPAPTPVAAPVQVAAVRPVPRVKPEQPVAAVPVPPAPAVAALQLPTQAEIEAGASPCGEACAEILFKQVDDCLWVQSQNPKPIMFQASVDGRMILIPLEGASYEKSSGTPAADASAYHARQRDPFQSSSAGIPVYRARIGDKGACVKDKSQITQFVAIYRK